MDIPAELIRQCADDSLQPAIVEQFLEAVATSPLAVTVSIDGKTVLMPKIETAIQAADIVAEYVGKGDVRFGITRYPAGVREETGQITEGQFEPCNNIQMGTQLFAGIYHAVAIDGAETSESFEQAMTAYLAGVPKPANAALSETDQSGDGVVPMTDSEDRHRNDQTRNGSPDIRIDIGRLNRPATE